MDMEKGIQSKVPLKRQQYVLIAMVVFICSALILVSFHHSPLTHSFLYEHVQKEGIERFRFRHSWFVTSIKVEDGILFQSNGTMNDVRLKGTKKLPQAIIIGAKKTGTRALLEFIRVHPNVRAAGHEVHYFDKNYSNGMDWYRNMMPTSIDGQITLEKTPSYLVTEEAPQRVHDIDPNMKIVIVVKDPVERAISDFTQSITKHRRRRTFEEFVFSDLENLIVNETRSPITTGMYSRHLENWLNFFPLSQICFISGETLITNPAEELKKLQHFLGLQRIITEEHFYFNSTKGFPCLKKREASGTPHCLGEGKGRTHPDVSIQVKAALYDYFRPFNLKFYKMSGIEFNWEARGPVDQLLNI